MTYSRIDYEPYVIETGEAVGPVDEYEDAAYEPLLHETALLQEIDDVEFPSSKALQGALAETTCAVRFVRSERQARCLQNRLQNDPREVSAERETTKNPA